MSDKPSSPHGAVSMEISESAFDAANRAGRSALVGPSVASAYYDQERSAIIVEFSNGAFVGVPVSRLQGLDQGTHAQLSNVVLEASGLGLHWPDLDADIYVPALLEGIFGSRKWMAAQLGSAGGKAKTTTKAASARLNGLKGGRPKKDAAA